jgi:hypothetical protein
VTPDVAAEEIEDEDEGRLRWAVGRLPYVAFCLEGLFQQNPIA